MAENQDMNLEQLKLAHDYYVTTLQILSQRCQFYAEEFEAVGNLVKFHKGMLEQLKQKIEALEPKKEGESGERAEEPKA
jgi:hypothetical protein